MTKSIAKKSTTGSLPPAVPLAITPTFSPWTHTSDDSYIYQLSLVLATATVSYPTAPWSLFGIAHVYTGLGVRASAKDHNGVHGLHVLPGERIPRHDVAAAAVLPLGWAVCLCVPE